MKNLQNYLKNTDKINIKKNSNYCLIFKIDFYF